MKFSIAVVMATVFSLNLSAQDTIKLTKAHLDPKSERFKVVTDRPPQVAFAELLGPALILSLNYDRRFEKRTDGFGFRAGVSTIAPDEDGAFIFVLGINHLVGNNKKGRFFESGINYTNLSYKNWNSSSRTNESFISLTLGYRSQPVNGGFCFRGGLSPIFVERTLVPFPYLSFGYNF